VPFGKKVVLSYTHQQHKDDDAKSKTYNSGYSLLLTHAATNAPVHCSYIAERTETISGS
jgi:hypothetical protein